MGSEVGISSKQGASIYNNLGLRGKLRWGSCESYMKYYTERNGYSAGDIVNHRKGKTPMIIFLCLCFQINLDTSYYLRT